MKIKTKGFSPAEIKKHEELERQQESLGDMLQGEKEYAESNKYFTFNDNISGKATPGDYTRHIDDPEMRGHAYSKIAKDINDRKMGQLKWTQEHLGDDAMLASMDGMQEKLKHNEKYQEILRKRAK